MRVVLRRVGMNPHWARQRAEIFVKSDRQENMHGASVVFIVSAWIEYPLRVKNLFQLFLNDANPRM